MLWLAKGKSSQCQDHEFRVLSDVQLLRMSGVPKYVTYIDDCEYLSEITIVDRKYRAVVWFCVRDLHSTWYKFHINRSHCR